MTAVAVNSFDIDWTLKIVSAFTGVEPPSSSWPKPWIHKGWSLSTRATARPGMPCSAISSGMRSRCFATTVAAASSARPRCVGSTGAIEGVVGMLVPPENTVRSTVTATAAATTSPTSSQRTDRCGQRSQCGSRYAPVELRATAPALSSFFAAVGTGGVFSGRWSSLVSISVGTSNRLSPRATASVSLPRRQDIGVGADRCCG